MLLQLDEYHAGVSQVKIMGLVDNIEALTKAPECASMRRDVSTLRKLVLASADALE